MGYAQAVGVDRSVSPPAPDCRTAVAGAAHPCTVRAGIPRRIKDLRAWHRPCGARGPSHEESPMLTIEPGAALRTRALASGVPRMTPLHDPLDKRHSDLSFSVDTGGRPRFRVLVARDRALFAPDQAGARNASNFYDSQREGLLAFDGPPCFYLVPRSALHAMLPAPRLYYTLIAYAGRRARRGRSTGSSRSAAAAAAPAAGRRSTGSGRRSRHRHGCRPRRRSPRCHARAPGPPAP